MATNNSESIIIELLTATLAEQMQTKAMLKTLISVSLNDDQKAEFNKNLKRNLKTIVSKTVGDFSFGQFNELKKTIEEID